ncbi:c-type cytochrome [Helicobacter ibis]|uniref:C-type cytochrome n=1 Tax=Helicobacter ibis TaxID=2962633 RepID=A0ABT4VDK8_9HELI|nr:c-type cytochrome [Helicobacter ibis]MDA3968253.1 c-type cytochrome [Helicobacter ibis]
MRFLFFLIPFFLCAEDSFITQIEYGRMLYENPRGIGCVECHGESGEGKIIANYTHKKKQKQLYGPKINDIEFDSFSKALQKSQKIMPKYYLTKQEIEAIYKYLESKKDIIKDK